MSKVPEHWSDLSEEERQIILDMAKSQLFWRSAFARFKFLGGFAQVALAIAAAWVLFKDGLAIWLQGLGK